MDLPEGITLFGVLEAVVAFVLPSMGFMLALLLLSQVLRERKPPGNAMAWLIGIITMPYLTVPLYLLVGKRKIRHYERAMVEEHRRTEEDCDCPEEVVLQHNAHGIFPTSRGNAMTLVPNGQHAFHETVRTIREAKSSIYLATYIFNNDDTGAAIRDELAKRAAEGIDVCVLVDAYGGMLLSNRFFKPLRDAGGRVAFHGSVLRLRGKGRTNLRNHRKLLICDGRHAIVGGMNVSGEYMGPREREGRWFDLAATLHGPAVGDLHDVFLADWKFATDEELPPFLDTHVIDDDPCAMPVQVIASGPDVDGDPLHEALLISLFGAQERVWVVTPYFIPDTSLLHAFSIAARRGIDVQIITPRRSNHPAADLARASYLHQLQDEGAKIQLFQPGMLHAKAILVDSDLAMLGSANIDMRSLFLNFEVTVCASSPDFADSVEQWMRDLLRSCSTGLGPQRIGGELIGGVGRLLAPLL